MVSYLASDLRGALECRARGGVIPYAGGTDLMIEAEEDASYLFLHKVPEMRGITEDGEYIRIGAACTFAEIAGNSLCPAILREAILGIAAPAIRNIGTIGGNIGNGSPKADTAPVLYVAGAKLRLMSAGAERVIPVGEFYLGRGKLTLKPDELIVEILIPKAGLDNYYYKKIGARGALAISRVSFAAVMDIRDGRIMNCATAFGAVSDTVICRADIDAMLTGRTVAEAKAVKADYLKAYYAAIKPIRGRVSEEYRKNVCMNLLKDFLETTGI